MLNQQNRDDFLAEIARQLGREVRHTPVGAVSEVELLAQTRLTDLSRDQRCQAFVDFARDILKAHCVLTSAEALQGNLLALCEEYGRTPVVVSGDARLEELGITQTLQRHYHAHVWRPAARQENIRLAERAKIGVVYAEAGLTESAGVVLFSAPERGCSISLLPETSIFVLRKSAILPRVAQLAQRLHHMAQNGEPIPACINLIAGPSSTADIELIKVVGVHGPVNAVYLIIEDC
ncbi:MULTISPECIES: LutC/YkgG family protein [unclassified Brenneria]|uniref:LutC/YkgG family protein n=1 Tax=unclassified Brenneria TaxID=2634434 RepID=UPI0015558B73|nr:MULTISPECIES: lactate utilization protein C [unclassified Brenneria]MBJ7221886.1 lactate utilization protein C [Brenneria sp. L3-3C-1]MEE3643129.1 lactate utilization protein C [Brenneria sp. L3_3C_1]MEE3650684.1 lactate utilization protein C [Brenneria sp. HEZEL_4_2_4]NPD00639.1 lactate utilization protein C [Brenneria sp. hezel4-2-4]